MTDKTLNITNRKASFEYHILQKYTAGIQLRGTEIKSVREGNVNISDGYCFFSGNELFVNNVNIGPYLKGTHGNHEMLRSRKLLLKKVELRKLLSKMKETGVAIVPIRIFMSESGYAKLEIALAKGKKLYDKRESIKERDIKRSMMRENS